jgi:threonine/homoserine/homoserine lactone efflux protein
LDSDLPLWGFIAVTAPLVLAPGASTAVVLRNSISSGTRGGIFTAIGANTGSVCYGLLTAFGFAAALARWPSVWLVLRWAGVGYLTFLGLQSLWRAFHLRTISAPASADAPRGDRYNLGSGFVTNVLNPSLMAFYLIVVPQFIPRAAPFARSTMILTLTHISMAFSWHCAWAVAGATLARALSRPRPRLLLHVLTGVALLALAAKVAI